MTLMTSTFRPPRSGSSAFDVRDLLAINGTLPDGIVATAYRAADGTLRLEGQRFPRGLRGGNPPGGVQHHRYSGRSEAYQGLGLRRPVVEQGRERVRRRLEGADRRSSRARSRRQQFHRWRSGRDGDIHRRRTGDVGHRYRRLYHRRQRRRSRRRRSRYSDGACARATYSRRRHAADRHHGIALQPVHRRSSRSAARRRSPTTRPRCAGGLQQHPPRLPRPTAASR